jgi:hypothetical protein
MAARCGEMFARWDPEVGQHSLRFSAAFRLPSLSRGRPTHRPRPTVAPRRRRPPSDQQRSGSEEVDGDLPEPQSLRATRSVPTRAAGGAEDGVHGIDLAAVHLEHVHVRISHEHAEPDPDAGLDIGEDRARRDYARPRAGLPGIVAGSGAARERTTAVFQAPAAVRRSSATTNGRAVRALVHQTQRQR